MIKKFALGLAALASLVGEADGAQYLQFEITGRTIYAKHDYFTNTFTDEYLDLSAVVNIDSSLYAANTPYSGGINSYIVSYSNSSIYLKDQVWGPTPEFEGGASGTFSALDFSPATFSYTTPLTGSGYIDVQGSHGYYANRVNFSNVSLTVRGSNTAFGSSIDPAIGYGEEAIPGAAPRMPEPGTWAMLILGFGMIGAALRDRQQRVPARVIAR
jgi:hypothetical protein